MKDFSSLSLFSKEILSELKDPRRTNKGNILHKLSDIVLLTISAVLCGADDWEAIENFGEDQETWLKKHGSFKRGIPSHDTMNRLFSSIETEHFNNCFIKWVSQLFNQTKGQVIPIDGKTMRGATTKTSKNKPPHIVSAFAAESRLCLGQIKTSEKSNEITAIPELLDLLFIEGSIITIDAMGCQTKIVDKIIEKKADYLLAVKGNQSNLELAISDTVLLEKPDDKHVDEDFGHGRIEKRSCSVYSNLSHVHSPDKWSNLKTLIQIETETTNKATGKTSHEKRFYISSLDTTAKQINNYVRKHWAIENNLHWELDVIFNEDASMKRKGNSATNFNIISKIALNMLTQEKTCTKSKKNKRLKAALNPKYRELVLKS